MPKVIRGSQIPFAPAAHEDPSKPGVLRRVLATRNDLMDGRIQMINWANLPAGRSFQAHYHEDMEEVFVILSGQASMRVDDQAFALNAGDAIKISPREVHSMENSTDQEVQFLVVGISAGRGGQTVVV